MKVEKKRILVVSQRAWVQSTLEWLVFAYENFRALVVLQLLVSLISCVVACSKRIETDRQTDRHTDTQTKYCNPRCACVPRVNNVVLASVHRSGSNRALWPAHYMHRTLLCLHCEETLTNATQNREVGYCAYNYCYTTVLLFRSSNLQ